MDFPTRKSRLRADFASLTRLQQASTVFSFECHGEPPDRYSLDFRGRGLARRTAGCGKVEFVQLHQVELRLPLDYPTVPPDLRWITPILHPNVSFSGFIQVRDLGLPWDDAVTLDVVCERLWDVARLAFVQLERTTNSSARDWLENQSSFSLPVDARPLRDRAFRAATNVTRDQRRGTRQVGRPEPHEEVLYIGEDTPVPPLPTCRPPYRYQLPNGSEDIFFIGDD